jgi:hypothetical protein
MAAISTEDHDGVAARLTLTMLGFRVAGSGKAGLAESGTGIVRVGDPYSDFEQSTASGPLPSCQQGDKMEE